MMKRDELILKRQKYNIRFKNEDMDFIFNWIIGISQIIGMAPAQAFFAVHGMKDGDPKAWRDGFGRLGNFQAEQAEQFIRNGHPLAAGQAYLAAAYAFRAGIQYTSPASRDFDSYLRKMEDSFQRGMQLIGVPIREIEVPFENITLPGYYLEHDDSPRPTVMMVGGGDTFREDLFYFAGYPGWKRGYNVLMVDLPGQGKVPSRGQYFRTDMDKPIRAILDWLESNAAANPEQIAIYGVSGGGNFTAQAVTADPRIRAWIASTPIMDIAKVFQREFGGVLKAPGWMMNTAIKMAGAFSESTSISLEKYAWQFGTANFKEAVDRVLSEAKPVDAEAICCPSLFLMSEGEGEELKRQTHELYNMLRERGQPVTLRQFTAAEGADAHCQLNNLRLAHLVIFDWLDRTFDRERLANQIDIRMLC